MNREDIIRMANEAGIIHPEMVDKTLERFAALVAKHTLANIDPSSFMTWQEGYSQGRLDESLEAEREEREAVEAEREACAKVCEGRLQEGLNLEGCAAAIRARGQE